MNFQYNYDTSGNTTYNTTAVVAIKAGDDANDLLGLHGAFCFNHVKEGLLLDWNSYMEYNDLTKPWWDADFCSNMTIAGKLYGMTGTISHTSIGGTFCLLFNKDMMDTLGIAYPYDSNVAYISDYHGEGKKIFEEGRALFAGASMGILETARDYDVELGVVPYPKYDESVSRYYSLVDAGQNVFSVPIVAQRLELISVITEALAAEGYKTIGNIQALMLCFRGF